MISLLERLWILGKRYGLICLTPLYYKILFKIIFKQSHLVAPSLFLLTFVKGRAARIRVKMEVFVLHITIHFTVIVLTRLLMELIANKVSKRFL